VSTAPATPRTCTCGDARGLKRAGENIKACGQPMVAIVYGRRKGERLPAAVIDGYIVGMEWTGQDGEFYNDSVTVCPRCDLVDMWPSRSGG
jgi:hypothetical protein